MKIQRINEAKSKDFDSFMEYINNNSFNLHQLTLTNKSYNCDVLVNASKVMKVDVNGNKVTVNIGKGESFIDSSDIEFKKSEFVSWEKELGAVRFMLKDGTKIWFNYHIY